MDVVHNLILILLLSGKISANVVIIGAIISVRYKKRMDQGLMSAWACSIVDSDLKTISQVQIMRMH
jgi:hypothetical protein